MTVVRIKYATAEVVMTCAPRCGDAKVVCARMRSQGLEARRVECATGYEVHVNGEAAWPPEGQ